MATDLIRFYHLPSRYVRLTKLPGLMVVGLMALAALFFYAAASALSTSDSIWSRGGMIFGVALFLQDDDDTAA
jgi:hypothetical protein